MKRTILTLFLTALVALGTHAQELSGTWQYLSQTLELSSNTAYFKYTFMLSGRYKILSGDGRFTNLLAGTGTEAGSINQSGTWMQTSDSTFVEHIEYNANLPSSEGQDNKFTYHFEKDGNLLCISYVIPGDADTRIRREFLWRVPQGNRATAEQAWSKLDAELSDNLIPDMRHAINEQLHIILPDSTSSYLATQIAFAGSRKALNSLVKPYTNKKFSAKEQQAALTGVWRRAQATEEDDGNYTFRKSPLPEYKVLRADGLFFNFLMNSITVAGRWTAMTDNRYQEEITYHSIPDLLGVKNTINIVWVRPDLFVMKNDMPSLKTNEAWERVTGTEAQEILELTSEWETTHKR